MSLPILYQPADSRIRRVAVTGMGSFTGPAIVQSIRATHPQIKIWGLDARLDTEALVLCDQAKLIPKAGQGLVDALLALVELERIDLLIPALDVELEELAPRRSDFQARDCLLMAGDAPFVNLCRSKSASATFLRSQGLPFAPTWRCEEVEDPSHLPLPLLLKPDGGAGCKGQQLLFSPEMWPADPRLRQGMVAQPLLRSQGAPPGLEAWNQPEFTAQSLHDGEGRLAGLFLGISHKRGGASWSLIPFRDPVIEAAVEAIARALVPLGLRGPCNFQGIATSEGPVFFELNPRFTGGTGLRSALGFQEVGACLGMLADGASAEAVGALLRTRHDVAGLRSSAIHVVPIHQASAVPRG